MESYLHGHDLWEVIAGSETTPPENVEALRKWRLKAGKAMFVLKTKIEEDLVEHIRDAETPKEAWETLAKLFSGKNEARLQLLENELARILQGTLSISQYLTKVKNIYHEISQLDPEEKISEARMRMIIIHGLRPEYNGVMAGVRGWPTQPSLVEMENLLANQEALAKEMGKITLKEPVGEEALFVSGKSPFRGQETAKEKWTRGLEALPNEKEDSKLEEIKHATSGGVRSHEVEHNEVVDGALMVQGDLQKKTRARNLLLPEEEKAQQEKEQENQDNEGQAQVPAIPIEVLQRVGHALGIAPDKLSKEQLEAAPGEQKKGKSADE
ncbi:hypothetical protein ACQ4PT_063857 [Festuca glaucescens]